MLNFEYFSSLNGVSKTLGTYYSTEVLQLYKELLSGEPISTDTLSCADNMATKLNEAMTKIDEELKTMRAAAATIQSAYCEVTKQKIGAIPGTDNGSGTVFSLY